LEYKKGSLSGAAAVMGVNVCPVVVVEWVEEEEEEEMAAEEEETEGVPNCKAFLRTAVFTSVAGGCIVVDVFEEATP
jgi:hypothetical protein